MVAKIGTSNVRGVINMPRSSGARGFDSPQVRAEVRRHIHPTLQTLTTPAKIHPYCTHFDEI